MIDRAGGGSLTQAGPMESFPENLVLGHERCCHSLSGSMGYDMYFGKLLAIMLPKESRGEGGM